MIFLPLILLHLFFPKQTTSNGGFISSMHPHYSHEYIFLPSPNFHTQSVPEYSSNPPDTRNNSHSTKISIPCPNSTHHSFSPKPPPHSPAAPASQHPPTTPTASPTYPPMISYPPPRHHRTASSRPSTSAHTDHTPMLHAAGHHLLKDLCSSSTPPPPQGKQLPGQKWFHPTFLLFGSSAQSLLPPLQ